jgi:hypothetical protein
VDTYDAQTTNETIARAVSVNGREPSAVAVPDGFSLAGAQGASSQGSAALIDDGATGGSDRFVAVSRNVSETFPDPDGAFVPGSYWPYFQGSGYGGEGFLFAGGPARMVSRPSRPACTAQGAAYRGYDEWTDCYEATRPDPNQQSVEGDSLSSGGINDGSPADDVPSLQFTSSTPGHALLDRHDELGPHVGRVPVEVELRTGDGEPIVGADVHVVLQVACGTIWCNAWQVEATSGPLGIARAHLPLFGTGAVEDSSPTSWRIYATFDGGQFAGGGSLPWHIAQPLQLG